MEVSVADITNNSQALQGVHTTGGVVYIQPGKTVQVELANGEQEHVAGLSFLDVKGDAPKTAAKSVKPVKPAAPLADDAPKTADEVLAMASDKDVQFLTFKAAATKLLGDKTPAKKDEIVIALEDLATQP